MQSVHKVLLWTGTIWVSYRLQRQRQGMACEAAAQAAAKQKHVDALIRKAHTGVSTEVDSLGRAVLGCSHAGQHGRAGMSLPVVQTARQVFLEVAAAT
jgi:hypothetical protein